MGAPLLLDIPWPNDSDYRYFSISGTEDQTARTKREARNVLLSCFQSTPQFWQCKIFLDYDINASTTACCSSPCCHMDHGLIIVNHPQPDWLGTQHARPVYPLLPNRALHGDTIATQLLGYRIRNRKKLSSWRVSMCYLAKLRSLRGSRHFPG